MMGFHSEERKEGEVPFEVQPLVDELVTIKQELDKLTEREKEIKTALKVAMQQAGEQKWVSDNFQCSIRAAYERESFDSTAFKKNEPAMYESYKKVTKYAETLTYKVL
jgi:predicted phage-related endonuclease